MVSECWLPRQSLSRKLSRSNKFTLGLPPPQHPLALNFTPLVAESRVEFAEKVYGEWDGYGADFSKEGEPIELPDSVVQEAFKGCEVKVFDWQTQCPTLAHPTHFQFFYKLIKLLPTVGCEAVTATRYNLLQRNINDSSSGEAVAFAYQYSGCYVAVWGPVAPDMEGSDNRLLELEHCLVDPRDTVPGAHNSGGAPTIQTTSWPTKQDDAIGENQSVLRAMVWSLSKRGSTG